MDDVRKEVAKWTPTRVERVTGVPGEQLKRVAEKFAKEKPATLIWCMGATQHTVGTANVRAFCILCLATGNIGKPGTGANIFRGHTNVQGATDLGLDVTTLPLYYGLVEGRLAALGARWDVPYDYLQARFDEVPAKAGRPARTKKQNMEAPGITSTRWFDGVNLPEDRSIRRRTSRR
jgi:formate dehydrogenase major subunit